MLKIVDIHPSRNPSGEYVVLQNQGLTTVSLRGWALCADTYLSGDPHAAVSNMYIFGEEIAIKPYTRIVLFTGRGEPGWYPTTDGKLAYVVYWNRPESAWSGTASVHLLHIAATRRLAVDAPVTVTV